MARVCIKYTLLIFWLIVADFAAGQNYNTTPVLKVIDSVKLVLKGLPGDTNKASILNGLSNRLKVLAEDSSLLSADSAKTGKHVAALFNEIGNNYFEQGNFQKSLESYFKALSIAQAIGSKRDMAASDGNLGNSYFKQGNYPQALEYYFKALNLAQEIGNKRSMASHLSNLAIAYAEQGNYPQALEYNFKALSLAQEVKDQYIISHTLDNIGVIYDRQGKYTMALQYLFKALTLKIESEGHDYLLDIGNVYGNQGNYPKALEYYSRALSAAKKEEDKDAVAGLYSNIGAVYAKMKSYKQAKVSLDSALVLSTNVGDKKYIENTYHELSVLDSATGNYKTSYQDYEKYIAYRDSLVNQESVKKITQMEISYRFEKREDSIKAAHEKADIIKTAEIKRNSIIIYSTIVILILTIISAILLISRQRIKFKKDKIIYEKEKQRMEDELRNAKTTLDDYVRNIVEKNEMLEQFKLNIDELKALKSRELDERRIEHLENLSNATILTEEDWDKFRGLFEQVYKGFFIRLKEKLPDLTQAEIRFICLTKLKLDTRQMAGILAVSFDTIKKSRYRLRKKLELSDEANLDDMISSI